MATSPLTSAPTASTLGRYAAHERVTEIVMTGTSQDGTLNASNCNGFTTTDENVYTRLGRVSFKDDEWASSNAFSCNQPARLYCFEQ